MYWQRFVFEETLYLVVFEIENKNVYLYEVQLPGRSDTKTKVLKYLFMNRRENLYQKLQFFVYKNTFFFSRNFSYLLFE